MTNSPLFVRICGVTSVDNIGDSIGENLVSDLPDTACKLLLGVFKPHVGPTLGVPSIFEVFFPFRSLAITLVFHSGWPAPSEYGNSDAAVSLFRSIS